MYWGTVFLAVSLLALPFAMGGEVVWGSVALVLAGVFAVLSAMSFVFGRDRGRSELPKRRVTQGRHEHGGHA